MRARSRTRNWAVAVAGVALGLALLRGVFHAALSERMDATFLALLAVAALAVLVDWDRVASIKAGSLEVTMERVEGALSSFPPQVDVAELRDEVARLQPLLPAVRGARVLWVEDHPATVRAERRLVRALGVTIVPATSSDDALQRLREDADFDAIVSDLQRRKEKIPEGRSCAGVWFLLDRIRNDDRDEVVRALPFLFYSAMPASEAEALVAGAEAARPPAILCRDPRDLLGTLVQVLWAARSRPPEGRVGKQAVYGSRWRGRR